MTEWTLLKQRRGVLSPGQPDFKERRLRAIARRQRAYLKKQARGPMNGDGDDGVTVSGDFDALFG